jgi:hypothetical protein
MSNKRKLEEEKEQSPSKRIKYVTLPTSVMANILFYPRKRVIDTSVLSFLDYPAPEEFLLRTFAKVWRDDLFDEQVAEFLISSNVTSLTIEITQYNATWHVDPSEAKMNNMQSITGCKKSFCYLLSDVLARNSRITYLKFIGSRRRLGVMFNRILSMPFAIALRSMLANISHLKFSGLTFEVDTLAHLLEPLDGQSSLKVLTLSKCELELKSSPKLYARIHASTLEAIVIDELECRASSILYDRTRDKEPIKFLEASAYKNMLVALLSNKCLTRVTMTNCREKRMLCAESMLKLLVKWLPTNANLKILDLSGSPHDHISSMWLEGNRELDSLLCALRKNIALKELILANPDKTMQINDLLKNKHVWRPMKNLLNKY